MFLGWHLYGRLFGVTSTGHRLVLLHLTAVVTYLILSMNDGSGASRVHFPTFFSSRSLFNFLCFAVNSYVLVFFFTYLDSCRALHSLRHSTPIPWQAVLPHRALQPESQSRIRTDTNHGAYWQLSRSQIFTPDPSWLLGKQKQEIFHNIISYLI